MRLVGLMGLMVMKVLIGLLENLDCIGLIGSWL
jgi:hypothetical protein